MSGLGSIFEEEALDTSFLEDAEQKVIAIYDNFDKSFGRFDAMHDTILNSALINHKKLMLESMENGLSKDEFAIMESTNESSFGDKLVQMLKKLLQMFKDFIKKLRQMIQQKLLNAKTKSIIKKAKKMCTVDAVYRMHNVTYSSHIGACDKLVAKIYGMDTELVKVIGFRRSDRRKAKTLKYRVDFIRNVTDWESDVRIERSTPYELIRTLEEKEKDLNELIKAESEELDVIITKAQDKADHTDSVELRDELLSLCRERTEMGKLLLECATTVYSEALNALIDDLKGWKSGGRVEYLDAEERALAREDRNNEIRRRNLEMAMQQQQAYDLHRMANDQHEMNQQQLQMQRQMMGFEEVLDLSEIVPDDEFEEDVDDISLENPFLKEKNSDEDSYYEEMNALFNDEFDY